MSVQVPHLLSFAPLERFRSFTGSGRICSGKCSPNSVILQRRMFLPRQSDGLKRSGTISLRTMTVMTPRSPPVGGAFHRPFPVAYERLQQQHDLQMLENMFRKADADKSGTVEVDEFMRIVNDPETYKIMKNRFGVQKHEAPRIFRALDRECSGSVSIDEWVELCHTVMNIINAGEEIKSWRLVDLRRQLNSHTANMIAEPALMPKKIPGRGATKPLTPR